MVKGFYVQTNGKKYFFGTHQKNRTDRFVISLINKIQNRENQFFNIGDEETKKFKSAIIPCYMKKYSKDDVYYRFIGEKIKGKDKFCSENEVTVFFD